MKEPKSKLDNYAIALHYKMAVNNQILGHLEAIRSLMAESSSRYADEDEGLKDAFKTLNAIFYRNKQLAENEYKAIGVLNPSDEIMKEIRYKLFNTYHWYSTNAKTVGEVLRTCFTEEEIQQFYKKDLQEKVYLYFNKFFHYDKEK